MRAILAVALGIFCGGCTTIPSDAPKYHKIENPPTGQSNLYIYRFAPRGPRTPTLSLDGQAIVDLVNGGYTVLQIPASDHNVGFEWPADMLYPTVNLTIRLQAGENFYLKFDDSGLTRKGVQFYFQSKVMKMVPEQAEEELNQCCRYIAPK